MARASQRLRTGAAYDGLQAGLERLRSDGWLIVQIAAAAAIAWLLAAAVLHHQQAGFAPIGAVIAVEVTRGQQVRHAIELVLGVTLGIGVAVLLGSVIGNPPLRIAVVVAVAMTLALLISGSLVLVVQASLAAIFLAATPSPTGGLAGEHLVEALIGGGLALVMTQVLFPLDPVKHVNQAAEPVFNRLADALEQVAAALAAGDRHRARQALEQARAIDPLVRSFQQALTIGYQVARLAPFRRWALGELDPYASAARQVDYAVRNTRVLAETVRTGGEVVAREPRRAAQRLALQAAVHAMTALQEDGDLAVAMVVGQVRSTVLDLLRCSGMELADAQQALDEAAGPAIEGA